MARQRHALDLRDTRAVLATTGDVSVGAFARRVRRKRIGIACVGLLLIAAGGLTYWALRESDPIPHAGTYKVVVRCSRCNHEATIDKPNGQVFPLICPACKERTCREVWQCRKCGTRFVPEGGGLPTACPAPNCRSAEVGSAATP